MRALLLACLAVPAAAFQGHGVGGHRGVHRVNQQACGAASHRVGGHVGQLLLPSSGRPLGLHNAGSTRTGTSAGAPFSRRGAALHALAIPAPVVDTFMSSGVQKILELGSIAALGAVLRKRLDASATTKLLLAGLVPSVILRSLSTLHMSLELANVRRTTPTRAPRAAIHRHGPAAMQCNRQHSLPAVAATYHTVPPQHHRGRHRRRRHHHPTTTPAPPPPRHPTHGTPPLDHFCGPRTPGPQHRREHVHRERHHHGAEGGLRR